MKSLKLSLALAVSLSLFGCSTEETNDPSGQEEPVETEVAEVVENEQEVESISVDLVLTNGNYTAGIDFPEGKYDIVAISGGGNVSSSNSFDGGINAIMGVEEENSISDIYEQEYKNIELPNGVVLTIDGVTVEITCDNASGAPLSPRNQSITEEVTLGNGNYVAGEDFPAGVYDLTAVSGGGNVSSDNMFDGGLNAIMGVPDMNTFSDMYEESYKNIELPEGVTLKIDGVELLLTPSK